MLHLAIIFYDQNVYGMVCQSSQDYGIQIQDWSETTFLFLLHVALRYGEYAAKQIMWKK